VGKNKQKRFDDCASFPHVIQPKTEEVFRVDYKTKGNWHKDFFQNNNPIVLELGCGKGEYTVALSRKYTEKNFVGVDIKGARIWRGALDSLNEGLKNVGFLRTRIEFIESCFAKDEVSEIWITFPDPQLKTRRMGKRLTSAGFLERYRKFLVPGGIVHLKTDSRELHDFTLEVIQKNKLKLLAATADLYNSEYAGDTYYITTHYESIYLKEGKPITYLRFTLDGNQKLEDPEPVEGE
jgi:tRNA (guanine-N7-)-methyltransferase